MKIAQISPLTQWHPAAVHYPLAFLTLECVFVFLFWIRPDPRYETFAKWLLAFTLISLAPVILTGLNDAGADIGPGIQFVNGLQDRVKNFWRLESTVSLHVMLVCVGILLLIGRSAWRFCKPISTMACRIGFGILMIATLLIFFVASYIGGSLSHS